MKKNRKKQQKKKLSALLLLLFLTVIMLATSTYAWFTTNKTVRIDSIDVNVAASSGLQISTDAQNWKTVITKNDIVNPTSWNGHTNQLPATLAPVSSVGTLDDNNQMQMFLGTVNAETGEFLLTSELQSDAKGEDGHYVAFDIFLKADLAETETEKSVYLTSGANVKNINGNDTGLKNASRVAFINQGNVPSSTPIANIQSLAGGESVIIWEPNSGSHTANAIGNANTYYGFLTGLDQITVSDNNAKLPYEGIKAEFDTGILLNETNKTSNPDYFADVTTFDTKANHDGVELFKIKKGVTKYRIYFWVEGQDIDCENNASGHDIALDLILSLDQN